MRRCVVIYHPDFDANTKEAIEDAKDLADKIKEAVDAVPNALNAQGAPLKKVNAIKAYYAELTYAVRKVDL